MGKTKVMKCEIGLQRVVDSGKYTCEVWGKGVENNSIQCTLCMKWTHKHCSGISRKLGAKDAEAFKYKTCVKGAQGLNKSEAGCVELDDGHGDFQKEGPMSQHIFSDQRGGGPFPTPL